MLIHQRKDFEMSPYKYLYHVCKPKLPGLWHPAIAQIWIFVNKVQTEIILIASSTLSIK